MTLETFSIEWFIVYYFSLGLLLLVTGCWLIISPTPIQAYLVNHSENEKPPSLFRNILKYWLLFTMPCLLLSFIPFSWTELLFSIWSLFIVYLAGLQLVRWPHLRIVIQNSTSSLPVFIRWAGVILMSSAVVIILLGYLKIQRAQLF